MDDARCDPTIRRDVPFCFKVSFFLSPLLVNCLIGPMGEGGIWEEGGKDSRFFHLVCRLKSGLSVCDLMTVIPSGRH